MRKKDAPFVPQHLPLEPIHIALPTRPTTRTRTRTHARTRAVPPIHLRRHGHGPRPRGGLVAVSLRGPAVWQAEEEQLVEDHAEGPHVGLGVDLLEAAGEGRREGFWGGVFEPGGAGGGERCGFRCRCGGIVVGGG